MGWQGGTLGDSCALVRFNSHQRFSLRSSPSPPLYFSVSRTGERTDTNKPKDDEDNFRQQPDWHPPGLAEERIDKLVKVHTDQLKYPPSFISLHSGRTSLLSPLSIQSQKKRINQINHSMGSSFFRSSRSNQ